MIADCPEVLRDVCRFLGIEYTAEMMEIEADTTYQRPNPSQASSWAETASHRDVQQVELALGRRNIQEAGYDSSENYDVEVTLKKRIIFGVEDRVGREVFALKRYGALLYAGAKVSRRMGINSLARYVAKHKAAVDRRYLR
jgi:hypothetical protein